MKVLVAKKHDEIFLVVFSAAVLSTQTSFHFITLEYKGCATFFECKMGFLQQPAQLAA